MHEYIYQLCAIYHYVVTGLMLSMEGVLVIYMVDICDTHYILLLLIKNNLDPNNLLAFTINRIYTVTTT